MGRFFPQLQTWEILLGLLSGTSVATGFGMCSGAIYDRFVTVRRERAVDSDFSMTAMRDRRVRKMNDLYLKRGVRFLVAGALGYLLLMLL